MKRAAQVPAFLVERLEKAFEVVSERGLRDRLRRFGSSLYEEAFHRYLCDQRVAADNGISHELVVLADTMRICVRSGSERDSGSPFDERELLVAVAVSLLHDLRPMKRGSSSPEESARRRMAHMRGGCDDARTVLDAVEAKALEPSFGKDVIERTLNLISKHDLVKCGEPYPESSDWLAVCCFEGDSLWVLHGLGVCADLLRDQAPLFAEGLRARARSNYAKLLKGNRAQFRDLDQAEFRDEETIFRTSEGASVLRERLSGWGLELPRGSRP
ncbi:MAG: hypothetical protein AAF517_13150 [Planctomycetota bacterium]